MPWQLGELLVVAHGELEVPRDDASLLSIPRSAPGQIKYFGHQELYSGSHVHKRAGADGGGKPSILEEPVETTGRELEAGLRRTQLLGLLRVGLLRSHVRSDAICWFQIYIRVEPACVLCLHNFQRWISARNQSGHVWNRLTR
jgi:hypothetical protein